MSVPAHVLSPSSPTPSSGTRPLPPTARPAGAAVSDAPCESEQDTRGRASCSPAGPQQASWWLRRMVINDELLQSRLCRMIRESLQQFGAVSCGPLPLAVRLWESGLQFLLSSVALVESWRMWWASAVRDTGWLPCPVTL